ncbi:hypothetical protein [Cytobacillus sp.]|uniref:hypothetical protein n=1 Tax=Cytobacillus sp. TaxID=2675269 RepID=UPI00351886FF
MVKIKTSTVFRAGTDMVGAVTHFSYQFLLGKMDNLRGAIFMIGSPEINKVIGKNIISHFKRKWV